MPYSVWQCFATMGRILSFFPRLISCPLVSPSPEWWPDLSHLCLVVLTLFRCCVTPLLCQFVSLTWFGSTSSSAPEGLSHPGLNVKGFTPLHLKGFFSSVHNRSSSTPQVFFFFFGSEACCCVVPNVSVVRWHFEKKSKAQNQQQSSSLLTLVCFSPSSPPPPPPLFFSPSSPLTGLRD